MARKLWAAADGNGGYDIGEGSFTLASVRNIRIADGYRVAKEYEHEQKREFDPRELAMLLKAAPDLLDTLTCWLNNAQSGLIDMGPCGWLVADTIKAIAQAKGTTK